jgi:hypothetical protein
MNYGAVNHHYNGEVPGGGDEDDQPSYETIQSRVAAGKLRSIEDLTDWLRSSLLLSSDHDDDDDENSGHSPAEIRVDESCWLHTGDPSRDLGPYELDLTLNKVTTTMTTTTSVTLAGPNADAVAATLSSVLALGLAVVKSSPGSNNGEDSNTTVTTTISIKAFATQPRRVLPRLTSSSFSFLDQNNDDEEPAASAGAATASTGSTAAAGAATTTAAPSSSSSSVSLLMHFCGIPAACPHWQRVCATVTSLELRQCQVLPVQHDETKNDSSSWNTLLGASASPSPVHLARPPRTLILSLTRPEFIAAFGTTTASGNDGVIIATNVHTLRMVLHFCLDDDAGWTTFCQHHLLYSNVRTLEIRYLDLGDDEWQSLWNNMPLSIEAISLSFTDDFVDDHRRMTEDRRRQRTHAVQIEGLYAICLISRLPTGCRRDERDPSRTRFPSLVGVVVVVVVISLLFVQTTVTNRGRDFDSGIRCTDSLLVEWFRALSGEVGDGIVFA